MLAIFDPILRQQPQNGAQDFKNLLAFQKQKICKTLKQFTYLLVHMVTNHCVKSVRIWSYSGPYFPAFGLNTERCSVSLRIQSECGKMRTGITPNTDIFYAVNFTFLSPFGRLVRTWTLLDLILE